MSETQGWVKGLKCRECGKPYPKEPLAICGDCFGPLEVAYDYEKAAKTFTREQISRRAPNMWRYKELLPIDREPATGAWTGFTPLVAAKNLARKWGLRELYVKNDAVSQPTLSFKDRVVSCAISKAVEFGFKVVGCASTGNLANAVAAQAAQAGLESWILIPKDLELPKVLGTMVYGVNVVGIEGNYDQVNRLCSEIADAYGWAFVNVNIRPYYGEGSKSLAFEVAEQLGWKTPRHMVCPMAGGSLITKVQKAFREMAEMKVIPDASCKLYGAQAKGCSPIIQGLHAGKEDHIPVKPDTIVKSLAIGDPADGTFAIRTMRQSGGWGESVTDEEVVDGIQLLAQTEGIYTETAGGVTVAVAQKLIREGRLPKDESVVLAITGNGLKTQEVVAPRLSLKGVIPPKLQDFKKLVN